MTLQAQLRLIAFITMFSLTGVIIFSVIQLDSLRNTFNDYEVWLVATNTNNDIENTRNEMAGLASSSEVLHRSVSRFRFTGVLPEAGVGSVQLLGT
ncbi:MAG: hypothetical protein WCZ98_03140 [Sideroxydans sp.]